MLKDGSTAPALAKQSRPLAAMRSMSMSPRQVFHLAVRLVGLLLVYQAFKVLPGVFSTSSTQVAIIDLLACAFFLLSAWWFLVGGPLPSFLKARDLTDLAYRNEGPS